MSRRSRRSPSRPPAERPPRRGSGLLALLALAAGGVALACSGPADASSPDAGAGQARLPVWSLDARPRVDVGGADAEGPAEFFGTMAATRLSDGRLVVADGGSKELRFFGPDGRHLRTTGGKGGGPGEFNFLTWVGRIAGDTVLAYDESTRRVSTFSPTGDFVRAHALTPPDERRFPEVVGAFRDGRILARLGFDRVFGRGERRDTVPFIVFSRDGRSADTVVTLPGTERWFVVHPGQGASQFTVGFGRDAHASVSGDLAVIGASDRYEVGLYDPAGRLVQRLRGEQKARAPTGDDVTRWRATLLVPEDAYPGAAARNRATSEVPFRPTYPAFAELAMSATGEYWLREYPPAGDLLAPGRWIVYDRTGTPRARVSTPARFTVLEVGADYVLGRWRDAQDVSHLRVHDLRRPR